MRTVRPICVVLTTQLCALQCSQHCSFAGSFACLLIGSRAASFKRPLNNRSRCLSLSVCVSETLMINISETKQFRGSCPVGSLYESVNGASIGDVIDDVTWLYDVILVTSQYSKSSHSKTRTFRITYPCGSFKKSAFEKSDLWEKKHLA